jgi:hypothetical protein
MHEWMAFLRKYLSAAGACLYLFTFGIFKARNRPFLGNICSHFGLGTKGRLPVVPADTVASPGTAVVVRDLAPDVGHISLIESAVLARLVRARGAKRIFEFGTFDGRTTLDLACNAEPDARVFTLDLPPGHDGRSTAAPLAPAEGALVRARPERRRFEGLPEADRIVSLTGDSATFDFAPYERSMDLVFVDGSHSFEYALGDSRTALSLVKPGGLVVWHDYGAQGWPGVVRALDALHDEGGEFSGLRHVDGTTLVILERPR